MPTQCENRLTYVVVADRHDPDCWRAEAIDERSDGECYVVIFSGPDAERMAREYAAWKNDAAYSRPAD